MKFRKILLIILAIVLIVLIAVAVWALVKRQVDKKKSEEALRNINVAALSTAKEKLLGTIYYPGGKIISDATQEGSNEKATFESTDSMDGASSIYYQDLLNRYKNYDVSKKTISKDDSADGKATVITCSGQKGKITITIWTKKDGLTQIEVVTSSDFK